MDVKFDLLGDPIPEGWGKRGRPPHVVTDEKRSLVIQLLALRHDEDEVAAALSVTMKTLRKYYFRELKARDHARLRVKAHLLTKLMKQADEGNVGAIRDYFARLDKASQLELAEAVANRGRPARQEKVGKKEAQQKQASEITGKYAPPAPPRLVN